MCYDGMAYCFFNFTEKMMKIKDKVITEIRKVYDPEIPVNIYDLGLIYNIEIKNDCEAYIEMTLTSPNCPVADSLPKKW